jgi:predicted GNAT family acetyltransferase
MGLHERRGCVRVGPVYTPRHWRGKGYGSAVTAAAIRDVLDDGGLPVLFTDLADPTSNDIYQRLGYYSVEDRLEIAFRSVPELPTMPTAGNPRAPSE